MVVHFNRLKPCVQLPSNMRVNQAEDPVGLGIDQPEVTKSSYTPDAQGDRQNPAEPPESDDEMDIVELPEDKSDHIQDAEEVQLPL